MIIKPTFRLALGIILSLLAAGAARAQIGGVNPATSSASIKFNDTLSLNGINPGSLYAQATGPWLGTPNLTLNQLDSTTLDYAYADVAATYLGPSYSIVFSAITLTQPIGNTGMADLYINFFVEYTMSATLGSQATLFPTLFVNGSVQSSSSSYAYIKGTIDYYDMNSGAIVDTVRYGYSNNTPGPFTAVVPGVAAVGTTPPISVGNSLGLAGNFQFEVDPANFTVSTVPEPTSGALLALGGAWGWLWRSRRKGQAARCASWPPAR